MKRVLILLVLLVGIIAAFFIYRWEQPRPIFAETWGAKPPFSFNYGGKDPSQTFLTWPRTEETIASEGGELHRYTYQDPATHLKVVAEVRTFTGFDAVDWVLKFTNEGTSDTPILEDIEPLHETVDCDAPSASLHCAQGSCVSVQDFTPRDNVLAPGASVLIGTASGRSSDSESPPAHNGGTFPFFNLQMGNQGVLGAIGWTGSWLAHFNRDASGKAVALDAGLTKTHLLLHPGEMIRTPRILLMNWKGDPAEAQNTWRKLMIAEYSPKGPDGNALTMPICWGTWGTERASAKLAIIRQLRERNIPIDVYWIDAGWYEPFKLPPGQDLDADSKWYAWRGDWEVSKDLFPDGLRPVGEAAKAAGMGFLLWLEPETANGNSKNLQNHPDWYLLPAGKTIQNANAFLNLGNAAARKWITDLVSDIITQNEVNWYRQDFNFAPASYWSAADTPDRVGMSETKSIMGLYQFWDDLRARHPGLEIDNCSSGGRRLDIEMMSRSVALWRSDKAGDPIGEQNHSTGLMPWVPLQEGVWDLSAAKSQPAGTALQLYRQRSAYCAGLCVCGTSDPAPSLKAALDEFREVRPYFYGDFYNLVAPGTAPVPWVAWQLQKPDRRTGLAVCFRRPGSTEATLTLDLHALDPQASYDVEVRNSLEKGTVRTMTGQDFAHLQVTISEQPGSALVFYTKH